MKTTALAILTALYLLVPAVSVAQTDGGFRPVPDRELDRGDRFAERRLQAVVEYLDLSEAQTYEWQTLSDTQQEARRASRDDLRANHEALRDVLDTGSADATRVGQMVIDLHARQQTLRAQHEADVEALKQILTPNQSEKLDALLTARALGPRFGERGPRGRHSRHGRTIEGPPSEGN